MTKHEKIQQQRVEALQLEFAELLRPCLEQCAKGRYGLFGHNEHLDPEHKWWSWPEAEHLYSLAQEIQTLRALFGEKNDLCDRFLYYRSLRGPNVPGEPKLAEQFLKELESTRESGYNTREQ